MSMGFTIRSSLFDIRYSIVSEARIEHRARNVEARRYGRYFDNSNRTFSIVPVNAYDPLL
jgi:hypothetical protein